MANAALKAGFQDSIHDSQATFKAVMTAMSRPGHIKNLNADLNVPSIISDAFAGVLLTLADHETPLWLADEFANNSELTTWLKFHTGARITKERSEAAFALIKDISALDTHEFSTGVQEYPDRSVTYIIEVDSLTNDINQGSVFFKGPGVNPELENGQPLNIAGADDAFWHIAETNHGLFPCGADFIFTSKNQIAALPRSTEVTKI